MRKISLLFLDLLLLLFSLAATILAIEAGLRLFRFQPPRYVTFEDARQVNLLYRPHQSARWCGQVGSVMDFDNTVQTNSLGLHDSDHTFSKPDGVYRILFLGDSFIEAFQVPLKDTFFKVLEGRLNASRRAFGGKRVEVIAIGRSGAGALGAFADLQKIGVRYKPDLIVAGLLTQNDFKDDLFLMLRKHSRIVAGPQDSLSSAEIRERIKKKLFDYQKRIVFKSSLLNRWLAFVMTEYRYKNQKEEEDRKFYANDLGIYEKTADPMFDASRPAWSRAYAVTLSAHLQMKKTADSLGARYVVFMLDDIEFNNPKSRRRLERLFPSLKGKLDFRKPFKVSGAYFGKNQIAYLDATPSFEESQSAAAPLHFPNDGHWTKAGHQVAADLLEKYFYETPLK